MAFGPLSEVTFSLEAEKAEDNTDEPVEPPPPAVVFEPGDIVGPLGGVLRRRKRYMAEHYGDSDAVNEMATMKFASNLPFSKTINP